MIQRVPPDTIWKAARACALPATSTDTFALQQVVQALVLPPEVESFSAEDLAEYIYEALSDRDLTQN